MTLTRRAVHNCFVAYFFVFATLFALLIPVYQSPDEPTHLKYINFVIEHHALPDQNDPTRQVLGEGHQFPLYYLIASGLTIAINHGQPCRIVVKELTVPRLAALPAGYLVSGVFPSDRQRVTFYTLRLFSALLETLNVMLMLRLLGLFFPDEADRRWTFLAGSFVVTVPQFLFISGSINNDNLANLLITGTLYQGYRVLSDPVNRRHWIWLGIVLGLALCAKKTSLFVVPGLLLVACWIVSTRRDNWKNTAYGAALAAAAALLLSGWVFVRNQLLYGEILTTRMERRTLAFAGIEVHRSLLSKYFLTVFPQHLLLTGLAAFGWSIVLLPAIFYKIAALMLIISAIGLGVAILQRSAIMAVGYSLLFVLLDVAGIIGYNLSYNEPQGRFLFPVLGLIAYLFAFGLRRCVCKLSIAIQTRLVTVLVGCGIALDVCSLWVIMRSYTAA